MVSDLAAHTGYWLRMVSNAVSQDFARKLADQGVTVAEWAVMRVLYDADAMAPTLLAERMGMTRGAISKLADRLLEKRLLERHDNPADKRAHSLSLSPAGRSKLPLLAALADQNDAEYFGTLSADEQAMLKHLLKTLALKRGLNTLPVD